MSYQFDHDLEFLSQCSNEDLEPLVEILTKDKDGKARYTENLTNTKLYKMHFPDHKKYWKEIAAELQTLGENTLVTLFRMGKGVSYREILFDVCKDLKVNFNKNSSTENIEKALLDRVLIQAVEELSEEQLQKVSKELNIPTTNLDKQATVAMVQNHLLNSNYIILQPIQYSMGTTILRNSTIGLIGLPSVSTRLIVGAITGARTITNIAAKFVIVPAVILIASLRKKYSS